MANERRPARFFNFWNAQTFHFYQWVMHSGKVPVDALIDRAWDAITASEDYRANGAAWFAENVDLASEVCEELVPLLEEVLSATTDSFFEVHEDVWFCGIQENGIEEYSDPQTMANVEIDALFGPILIEALRGIQMDSVAEAILIAKGRWIPYGEVPEGECQQEA